VGLLTFNNEVTIVGDGTTNPEVVTGDKLDTVRYYRHSRYPGGLKSRTIREMMDLFPERVIYEAVRGMMPKTKLGRAQMRKLRVYAGDKHPHEAQLPRPLEIKE